MISTIAGTLYVDLLEKRADIHSAHCSFFHLIGSKPHELAVAIMQQSPRELARKRMRFGLGDSQD